MYFLEPVDCNIIEIDEHWCTVEFEDYFNHLQRKLIPRGILLTSRKGPAPIDRGLLAKGLEFSDVDLPEILGDIVSSILLLSLQDDFRRVGLWRKTDYSEQPMTVLRILKRYPEVNMDAGVFINTVTYGRIGGI